MEVAPVLDEYVPYPQLEQVDAPVGAEYLPMGHSVHCCALPVEYLPGWHTVHRTELASVVYSPAGQLVQEGEPAEWECWPEGHWAQFEELDAPTLAEAVPGEQYWQTVTDVAPDKTEKVPAGQPLQSCELYWVEYFPTGQAVHADAPMVKVPGAQAGVGAGVGTGVGIAVGAAGISAHTVAP